VRSLAEGDLEAAAERAGAAALQTEERASSRSALLDNYRRAQACVTTARGAASARPRFH
jgi:hypothetical protein